MNDCMTQRQKQKGEMDLGNITGWFGWHIAALSMISIFHNFSCLSSSSLSNLFVSFCFFNMFLHSVDTLSSLGRYDEQEELGV
jgi:hypothetical protein